MSNLTSMEWILSNILKFSYIFFVSFFLFYISSCFLSFQTYVDIFNSMNNINVTAVILSCITILALIFNNEVLKVRNKHNKFVIMNFAFICISCKKD